MTTPVQRRASATLLRVGEPCTVTRRTDTAPVDYRQPQPTSTTSFTGHIRTFHNTGTSFPAQTGVYPDGVRMAETRVGIFTGSDKLTVGDTVSIDGTQNNYTVVQLADIRGASSELVIQSALLR